jgi:hypothetical protein
LLAAVSGAPARAILALVRDDTAPQPVDLIYSLTTAGGTSSFDCFTLINLTGSAITSPRINNVSLAEFPSPRRTEFGGPGTRVSVSLLANQAWAVNGPNAGNVLVEVQGNGLTKVFDVPDGNVALYLVPPCGAADVGAQGGTIGFDGLLDNNDFAAFINLFFANDPRADVGSQGGAVGADGQFNNNDFAAFITLFFAGCP